VKSGALTPEVLCNMTAKELASRELDNIRKQQQKEFMKDKVVPTAAPPLPIMGKGNLDIEQAPTTIEGEESDSSDSGDDGGENVSAGKKKSEKKKKPITASSTEAASVTPTPGQSLDDILGGMDKKESAAKLAAAEAERNRLRQQEIAEFAERQVLTYSLICCTHVIVPVAYIYCHRLNVKLNYVSQSNVYMKQNWLVRKPRRKNVFVRRMRHVNERKNNEKKKKRSGWNALRKPKLIVHVHCHHLMTRQRQVTHHQNQYHQSILLVVIPHHHQHCHHHHPILHLIHPSFPRWHHHRHH
jgi:hypothetical protein